MTLFRTENHALWIRECFRNSIAIHFRPRNDISASRYLEIQLFKYALSFQFGRCKVLEAKIQEELNRTFEEMRNHENDIAKL